MDLCWQSNISAFQYSRLVITFLPRSKPLLFIFFNFILFNFTILYWFCHISKWICHRYTCVPHPEPSSLLPPHIIPLGRPSAPAPRIQYCASNLDCPGDFFLLQKAVPGKWIVKAVFKKQSKLCYSGGGGGGSFFFFFFFIYLFIFVLFLNFT